MWVEVWIWKSEFRKVRALTRLASLILFLPSPSLQSPQTCRLDQADVRTALHPPSCQLALPDPPVIALPPLGLLFAPSLGSNDRPRGLSSQLTRYPLCS